MTAAIIAALVHVLQLVVEWHGGFISLEKPRLRRRETSAGDLDRYSSTVWDAANVVEVVGLILAALGVGRLRLRAQVIGLAARGESRWLTWP
jgi:hypothetical protein